MLEHKCHKECKWLSKNIGDKLDIIHSSGGHHFHLLTDWRLLCKHFQKLT